jgi:hypothetical protein
MADELTLLAAAAAAAAEMDPYVCATCGNTHVYTGMKMILSILDLGLVSTGI